MENENLIRTLGDYSIPSHAGYRNTIELPNGNNVVTLRSDTIRRTAKLRNDILIFQQHQGKSLSEAWTRFKDLLQKFPHHGIDLWLQIQIFYDHVSFQLKCEIDRAASGKLCEKKAEESWEIIENLSLYGREDWNDSIDFVKPVAHTERTERFKKSIFKQREEINDIMAEMFGLLKELTASSALEKILVREEARHPITKHVNSIYLIIMEEGKVIDKNVVELNESDVAKPIEVIDRKEETEGGADDETIRNVTKESEEELVEMPRSQPVGYYLKHEINKELLEGII
ncbi:hypothetical protein Tco_1136283 [Tanacetum coccineum]